jgi:hypothetical protein
MRFCRSSRVAPRSLSGKHVVGLGLLEPQIDQLFDLVGVLVGEVVGLRAVCVGVEELPAILIEVSLAEERTVLGHCLPALVPDPARAEHLVVLDLLAGRRIRGVEAVAHRHARQRRLLDVAQDLRDRHAAAVEDRRDDVGAVVVLVAHLAPGLDPLRPVDDQRIAHAALVGVALEHLVRRRERHRPAGGVVVVALGPAELVDQRQVLLDRVGPAVEELVLVDRPVRRALAGGAVVGAVEDQRVVELAGLLEEVDDPADLVICVLTEAGVHLGHPAEQRFLLV